MSSHRPHRFVRVSIFHRQACFAVLLVIVVGTAIGFIGYGYARLKLRQEIHARLSRVLHDRVARLEDYVALQQERVTLVASRTQLRKLLADRLRGTIMETEFKEGTQRILRDALHGQTTAGGKDTRQGQSEFLDIFVTDPQGTVVTATSDNLIGTDFSDRPEFAVGKSEAFLGLPIAINNRYEAFLVAPARTPEAAFLGVVGVRLNLKRLQLLLADNLDLKSSAEVLFATREGNQARYLMSPGPRPPSPVPLSSANPMAAALKGERSFGDEMYNGTSVLAAWQSVDYHDASGDRCAMVVKVDADQAYEPVAKLGQIVFAAVLCLLLPATVLAYVTTQWLSRPILRLVKAADEVARGNLGQRVPVNSSDEIGTLALAFNDMNVRLAASYDSLEKRVRERTEELRRSNAELEQFASIASHDLQAPLRNIQAFGELLTKTHGDQLGEEGEDYLRRMCEAAARMRSLIQALLSYARVNSRGKPFEQTSAEKVAREAVQDLETQIRETGGQVQIDALPEIDADPTQLRQLLQNLIGNGLKYRRPDVPPEIRVSAEELPAEKDRPPRIRLVVKDNGIGFDLKYLDRVFAPFQRLHGNDKYEGNGIGLAVCRKIAERHGGEIDATSEPGKGSRFVVELPVRQPED